VRALMVKPEQKNNKHKTLGSESFLTSVKGLLGIEQFAPSLVRRSNIGLTFLGTMHFPISRPRIPPGESCGPRDRRPPRRDRPAWKPVFL